MLMLLFSAVLDSLVYYGKIDSAYLYAKSLKKEKQYTAFAYINYKLNRKDSFLFYIEKLKTIPDTLLIAYADAAKETHDTIRLKRVRNFLKRTKKDVKSLYRAWNISVLIDEQSLKKKFEHEIFRRFLNTKEAYTIASSVFYDTIYPVWNKDSLMVQAIKWYFKNYSGTEWDYNAYRFLLSALLRINDTFGLKKYAKRWVYEDSANILVYRYVAQIFLRAGFDTKTVRKYALYPLEKSLSPVKPKFMPFEQWQLDEGAIIPSLYSTLAETYLIDGNYKKALRYANIALRKITLNNETELSPTYSYYIRALSFLSLGDTADAMSDFVEILISGDRTDVYPSKADSIVKVILKDDMTPIELARKIKHYKGPIFKNHAFKVSGRRVAWGDYNNDGYDDLLLDGCKLFKNFNGDSFIDVTDKVNLPAKGHNGGLWADFNNDGLLDIFAMSQGKYGERLYLNKGDRFVDITGRIAPFGNAYSTEGFACVDVNNDGYIDVYLANYENWKEHKYYRDQLFINDSARRFIDKSKDYGIIYEYAGRGVSPIDIDLDGDMDIYVSNYRLNENLMLVNMKDTFVNMARKMHIEGIYREGWWGHTIGSEWGDYDCDGDMDLITCNLAHPRYIEFSNRTVLYKNVNGTFIDVRRASGIKYNEVHSEPSWIDIDADGDLDLFITCVYPRRRSFLYLNDNGKFRDITYLSGVRVFNSWTTAASDYDNDGDMDLAVAGGGGVYVFENTLLAPKYLEVKVILKHSAHAIGTRLMLTTHDGMKMMRMITGGKGTTSQPSEVQYFGLEGTKGPYSLVVYFPDGTKKAMVIKNISRRIIVKE